MGSTTAKKRDATAIPKPNRINTSRHTQRAELHGSPSPANVKQLFVRAADPQLDFDPKQMTDNGSIAKITPRTHGKIRAPLLGVETRVLNLSAPTAAGTAPRPAVLFKREDLKDQRPNWHHSQSGELVRRIGTVPAMSAWKTAAGPPEPGQGSRLRRDRQSRQPGLDRVSVVRPFGFHALMASCERGAPLITRRSSPAGQLSDRDRKRS
jgi:hypothetical protein